VPFFYWFLGWRWLVFHIERGDLLDILEHPNPSRYAGQRIFVGGREGYVNLVPLSRMKEG
jgi:hypothetical protein